MGLPNVTLVLGGAASGKSGFAEGLIAGRHDRPLYLATAQVYDDEMAAKVAAHKKSRGPGWHTVEAPVDLNPGLAAAAAGQPVLIDCATLWLTNVILGGHDVDAQTDRLLVAIRACAGPVVVVSNEVGQGIVPDNALSRRFRNAQGTLNQRLAQQADLVVGVMAGLPLVLKGRLP